MADLVITAASVAAGAGATIDRSHNAGATVTAGQVVYLDSATNTYLLADNNSATVAARTPSGIALNGASAGQPLAVVTAGPVTIGATLAPNVAYYLSGTAGAICPVADLVTGMLPGFLGFAISATVLSVNIQTAANVL
jgi:hypothetical protein